MPFGAYKTYQTKIAEIERLTGLAFMCGAGDKRSLRELDPLERCTARPPPGAHARPRPPASRSPQTIAEISDLEDIQV